MEELTLAQKISQNIQKEIENSGKQKAEIARAIGVSRPTVTQYCTGRAQPSLDTLSKLCRFLDISADDILEIKIIIHPQSGWYFIFGHSPNHYWQRTSAPEN